MIILQVKYLAVGEDRLKLSKSNRRTVYVVALGDARYHMHVNNLRKYHVRKGGATIGSGGGHVPPKFERWGGGPGGQEILTGLR